MLVLIDASMLCSICVRRLLLIMFYCCSLAHPCCVLLVLVNVFFLCSIGAHQRVLAMIYWCLLMPPCSAILLFIGTSLLHFLTCNASCTFLTIVFIIVHWCSLSFQIGTSPLHFGVEVCVGVEEKQFQLFLQLQGFFLIFKFFSRVSFFEVFHFYIFSYLIIFSFFPLLICFQMCVFNLFQFFFKF